LTDFDRLVAEAEAQEFSGWDFSFFDGRIDREGTPWNYGQRVSEHARTVDALLDLGTGGGEFLSDLAVRPRHTVATEGWMPNVPVAARRLRPLGVEVVAVEGAPDNADQDENTLEGRLPFRDEAFDVVIDRHEAFRAAEVARVLHRGGTFVTQQVGSLNEAELNERLLAPNPPRSPDVGMYVRQLEGAGLRIVDAQQARPRKTYKDIAAIVFNLLAIPWQVPGFNSAAYREQLIEIHEKIEADGGFTVHEHRLFFEATRI
jgi:SAM-dependent methyltransferase